MKRKFYLIIALVLAVIVSGGLFAYTYTNAAATLTPAATKAEIATVASAAAQPDWDSVIPDTHTEILRPTGAGDKTEIAVQYPDSGEHWQKVDEAAPDGDGTYIATDENKWKKDLYNITGHTVSGTVDHVKVYISCRAVGTPTQTSARVFIKTEGKEKEGSEVTVTTSYATYSYQWDTNPETGNAWTWAEIDALQIGVKMRNAADGIPTRCTQVYVEVQYTPPICGDVPTGNLFDVTPEAAYTGDLQVKVYLTNTGALVKAYQYLNMKLYLEGSVEAGETPNYRLLTLQNGVATFNLKGYAPGTYTLSVGHSASPVIPGGSYCLVSTDSSEWQAGASGTPELYCEVTQSG